MKARLIVVGVDGSDQSKAALRWAIDEARLRGAAVRVVHAWSVYPALYPGTPIVASDWEALHVAADEFVQDFVAENVPEREGVEITAVAVQGSGTAAQALVNEAKGAELLVVGSRGLGGFTGLLLGSVSQQCVHHAPCPVVIVRGAEVAADQEQAEHAAAAVGT